MPVNENPNAPAVDTPPPGQPPVPPVPPAPPVPPVPPRPEVAETHVSEAQQGNRQPTAEEIAAKDAAAKAEVKVHEAQPRSAIDDTNVGRSVNRETVPPVERAPGVPLGGKRLRRYLKD